MARKAQTEADWRAKVVGQHLPAMAAAQRSLTKPDDDGEHREAAKVIEAGGCYIRRGLDKGWSIYPA